MKNFLNQGCGMVLLASTTLFSCQQDIQPGHDVAVAQPNLQYVKMNPNDDRPSFALGESAPIVLTGRSKQEAWEAAKKIAPVNIQLKKNNVTPQQLEQLEKEFLANFEAGSSQALTAQLFFAVVALDKYWLHQPESAEKVAKANHYLQLLYNNQYSDPFLSVGVLAYLKNNIEAQQWQPMAQEFLVRGKKITDNMETFAAEQQKSNPANTPLSQAFEGKHLEHIAIRKQRLAELENMLARSR